MNEIRATAQTLTRLTKSNRHTDGIAKTPFSYQRVQKVDMNSTKSRDLQILWNFSNLKCLIILIYNFYYFCTLLRELQLTRY
jgi:hypothetical protein